MQVSARAHEHINTHQESQKHLTITFICYSYIKKVYSYLPTRYINCRDRRNILEPQVQSSSIYMLLNMLIENLLCKSSNKQA